jgi:hypothetical protein
LAIGVSRIFEFVFLYCYVTLRRWEMHVKIWRIISSGMWHSIVLWASIELHDIASLNKVNLKSTIKYLVRKPEEKRQLETWTSVKDDITMDL